MSGNPVKVLLVEDNPGDARLIGEMLTEVKGASFDLECTDRLSAGLERLAAGGIGVVLLDLSLPDSRGLDTFIKVHAEAPQVPIIVLTGLDDESLAVEAVREGAQDYLVKGQVDGNLLVRAMRYAIERKRAEEEIKRRNEELAALNAIATAVSQSLDLREILDAALEKTLAVLNVGGGLICLFDEINQTFAPAVHRGISQDVLWEVTGFKKGEGLSGYVAESGEPLVVADIGADPRNTSPASIQEGWHSYAGVPIKCKEKVLGVMTLGTRQEGYFKPGHINLLIHIGNQIGVAIENARLYQETVRRLKETETLSAVTTALTRSLDLDQVLQSIVDSATWLISTSTGGVIHLAEETEGKLIPRATSAAEVNIQEKLEMSIGEGIAGLVMQEKRLINVPNVDEDPRFLTIGTATPKKSLLTAPLMMGDRCLGTISLHSNETNAFTPDDERLLSTLASQAAIAVENARLYEKVTERMVEATLLHRVSNTLIRTLNLERLLENILEVLQKAFGYSHCAILLPDEDTGELCIKAARGYLQEMRGELRVKIGEEEITGWVAANKVPLNVPDVTKDDRYVEWVEGIKSEVAVPMLGGEQVVGVLDVQSTEVNAFDENDLRTLSLVAAQAAIAIERARLFQEVHRRSQEQATLFQASAAVLSTLHIDEVLHEVAKRMTLAIDATIARVCQWNEAERSVTVIAEYIAPQASQKEKVSALGTVYSVKDLKTVQVLRDLQPLTVSLADPEISEEVRTQLEEFGGNTVLYLPLAVRERVIGYVEVWENRRERHFTQEEINLCQTIGNQAAIAIENARLFARLKELDRMKSDFVSNVSHELRTPLANIKLYAALAQKGHPEKRQHYLGIIESETERLETLIEDILDLSRLERGAVKLQMEPLPLTEIVQQVVGAHLATAQAKGVELTWQVPDGLPALQADRTQLLLMLNNLLGNALQYTPCGGSVWVEARAGEWRGQPAVHIAVRDTGMGIPADEHERIFERFYRGRHTPVGTTGTGLGLTIVKESMTLHGGEVRVESAVGQGSTFTLCFPLETEVNYAQVAIGGRPYRLP